MKLRKAIKNIIALGTGLTMLGATVFGAMAADLGAYPTQYIKDGKFNGLMVVGAKANTADVLGIVDIATSLQFASKKETVVSETGATASLSGDVYMFGSSADILELKEYLGDVKSTLTDGELGALGSTTISTQLGTTSADQYLKFNATGGLKVVYDDNKDRVVGDYLTADDKSILFNYELQFPDGLKSYTYTTSSGNTKVDNTTATSYMNDIEDENLFILGDTFNIVEATIAENTDGGKVVLTLMGGAASDTLKEGETKTYDIDGKSYEVTIVIVADAQNNNDLKTKLMINGEVTKSLADGDTAKLADGTVIGIKSILANEGSEENGADLVSFYIGANKVVLTDADTDTSNFGGDAKIDEENIEEIGLDIASSWNGNEADISTISFRLKADSKESGAMFVESGDGVRAMLDEPTGMLSRVWDIVYMGLSTPAATTVALEPSGDDIYNLVFTNVEGIEYTVPLVDNSDGAWRIGTDQDDLIYTEASDTCNAADDSTKVADLDDYIVVSARQDQDKAFTKVLQIDSIEAPTSTDNGKITFSDIEDGSSKSVSVPAGWSGSAQQTSTGLIVGGKTYEVTIRAATVANEDTWNICVDLDNSGDLVENQKVNMITQYGANISFVSAADGALGLSLTVPAKYFDERTTVETFNLSVTETGTPAEKVDSDVSNVDSGMISNKGSDDKSGMTLYGIKVEQKDGGDSEDPDTLTITIPEEQVQAMVYVTGGDSSASTASGKKKTQYEVQKIEVGAAVQDEDVADVEAQNIITVGGPCANKVSAALMDISNAAPACYEDFPVEEGQGIIKMVDSGSKVALVVAGYSAADTRKAAQVLANYEDYAADLKGKSEVVVSGTKILAANVAEEE